jgi:hypothetical protein
MNPARGHLWVIIIRIFMAPQRTNVNSSMHLQWAPECWPGHVSSKLANNNVDKTRQDNPINPFALMSKP